MKVIDIIDNIISHNEIIALWVEEKDTIHYHRLVWKGMAHQLPDNMKNLKFCKIFGCIPEDIMEADTINIEVEL